VNAYRITTLLLLAVETCQVEYNAMTKHTKFAPPHPPKKSAIRNVVKVAVTRSRRVREAVGAID